jgi:hypothetical protein
MWSKGDSPSQKNEASRFNLEPRFTDLMDFCEIECLAINGSSGEERNRQTQHDRTPRISVPGSGVAKVDFLVRLMLWPAPRFVDLQHVRH